MNNALDTQQGSLHFQVVQNRKRVHERAFACGNSDMLWHISGTVRGRSKQPEPKSGASRTGSAPRQRQLASSDPPARPQAAAVHASRARCRSASAHHRVSHQVSKLIAALQLDPCIDLPGCNQASPHFGPAASQLQRTHIPTCCNMAWQCDVRWTAPTCTSKLLSWRKWCACALSFMTSALRSKRCVPTRHACMQLFTSRQEAAGLMQLQASSEDRHMSTDDFVTHEQRLRSSFLLMNRLHKTFQAWREHVHGAKVLTRVKAMLRMEHARAASRASQLQEQRDAMLSCMAACSHTWRTRQWKHRCWYRCA